jgi:N4-gp56 family major capsid protein
MAINTTLTTAAPQTYMNKTFYDKNLLEIAKTMFVFADGGDKKFVPLHSGKKVEFRRKVRFDPNDAMTPLVEGVTPTGLLLSQEKVEAELKQYGAYFTFSDFFDKTAFDELKTSGSEDLGQMLGTVVEWVTRDVLAAGDNVNYTGGKTSRWAITAADELTIADVRKAVRDLKIRKAPQFTRNGKKFYKCYVSPSAIYDLQGDSKWEAANTYVNNEALFTGELGRLYGMVFIEASEAPIVTNVLETTLASYTDGTKTIVVDDDISDTAYAYLTSEGAQILVGTELRSIASVNQETKSIVITESLTDTTPDAGIVVRSKDGSATGDPVHQTICVGEHAYGTVELSDESGRIAFIVKDIGSGGTEDALDQRGTIGAKVGAYAAVILNEDWIVRIEHGVTA